MKNYVSYAALAVAITVASPAYAQVFSGPYVGASAGINAGHTSTQDYWCDAACDAPSNSGVDLAGGINLGFNHQIDENFVIGLEADLSTGFKDTDRTVDSSSCCSDYVYNWNTNLRWISTIRARAGLAVNKSMFYMTGGLALTGARLSQVTTTNANYTDYGAHFNGTLMGYALGGGIEHAVSDHISVKAEFMHDSFGKKRGCYMDLEGSDAGVCWNAGDPGMDDYVAWQPSVNTARIGFNYRF